MASTNPKARRILENVLVNFGTVNADADVPDPAPGTGVFYLLDGSPPVPKMKRTDTAGTTTTVSFNVT